MTAAFSESCCTLGYSQLLFFFLQKNVNSLSRKSCFILFSLMGKLRNTITSEAENQRRKEGEKKERRKRTNLGFREWETEILFWLCVCVVCVCVHAQVPAEDQRASLMLSKCSALNYVLSPVKQCFALFCCFPSQFPVSQGTRQYSLFIFQGRSLLSAWSFQSVFQCSSVVKHLCNTWIWFLTWQKQKAPCFPKTSQKCDHQSA